MAILEGRWDCSSCGRVGNMGHDVHCPGCGKPRGAVTFYLPENPEAVADAERLAEAKAGPDWVCAYCEASNRSTADHCTGCGAARSEGKARAVGGGDEKELSAEQIRQNEWRAAHPPAPRKSHTTSIVLGLLACLFVGCSGFGTIGFLTRAGGERGVGGPAFRWGAPQSGAWVTVTAKLATRSIVVETEKMVQDASWCSSAPADAHVLDRRSKQDGTRCEWRDPRATRRPLAAIGFFGTKNLGNGYFESTPDHSSSSSSSSSSESKCRNIPVYRDWCSWEAKRWVAVRTPSLASTDALPEWPPVELRPGEREGARTQALAYDAQTSDGELVKMTADESHWITLTPGAKYSATFSLFGGLKSVGDPLRN